MSCYLQLYLALSGVLASGGAQPLAALQEADAELAALVPDALKSKVPVLRCLAARNVLSSHVRAWLRVSSRNRGGVYVGCTFWPGDLAREHCNCCLCCGPRRATLVNRVGGWAAEVSGG